MFWEEHLKRVVVILKKRLPMQTRLLHLDNSQVQHDPETSLPMVGSMVAVWCDTPSEEYIEKNVFDLKWKLLPTTTRTISRQTSLLLEKAVATVPTDLDIYTPESRARLAKVLDSLNWNVSRAHQDQVDQEVVAWTQALAGLKPITQVGSFG